MNQNVTKIEAVKPKTKYDETEKPINVCAYCRVSTDNRDQANSFESQQRFFEREFKRHDNWKIKKIYADKGISGTSIEKRDEFNRMIQAAKLGTYDLILIKEVSRFSRNMQDIMNVVEDLRKRKVFIFFLTDDINTENADYRELLTTAGLQAEAESRKTSKRVHWGHLNQMEAGVVFGRKEMLGYNIKRDDDGKQYFEIIPEEAEIVKTIFKEYVFGDKGTFQIAKLLQKKGIQTKQGNFNWTNTVILRVLKNEKYVGDLVQGKTYTPDFLDHKKQYNHNNESEIVIIRDHHPNEAIIDRDLWDKAQAKLEANTSSNEAKAKHSNRYWCSGKVFCGNCGNRYISKTRKLKAIDEDGNQRITKRWLCWEKHLHGQPHIIKTDTGEEIPVGCSSLTLQDKVLKTAAIDLLTDIMASQIDELKNDFNVFYEQTKDKELAKEEKKIIKIEKKIDDNKTVLEKNYESFLRGIVDENIYISIKEKLEKENAEMYSQIEKLRSSNYSSLNLALELERKKQAIDDLLNLKSDDLNDSVLLNLIDRIVVYDDHLEYFFVFYDKPYKIRFKTKGRLDGYQVFTEVILD